MGLNRLDKFRQSPSYEYENPGVIFNKKEWTIIDEKNGVPQQENRYDCGVFACFMSDFVCRGFQLHFS